MLKEQQSIEELVEQDLKLIFESFFETALENPKDSAAYERLEMNWIQKLEKYMPAEDIRDYAAEYFLFIYRQDLWQRHLMKTMNRTTIRPATKAALENWLRPFVLYAEVSEVHASKIEMKEIFGNGTYYYLNDPDTRVKKGDLIFGTVFSDNRELENGIFIVQSLSFLNGDDPVLKQRIEELASGSNADSSAAFFQDNMLEMHRLIGERELLWENEPEEEEQNLADNIAEYLAADLRPLEREVMQILYEALQPFHLSDERMKYIELLAVSYFANVQPDFRKPEIVAAALFKVAYDVNVFPGVHFSQAEIAKMFHTSTSSMMKHADRILANFIALTEMQ